jgi:hypothetical protein
MLSGHQATLCQAWERPSRAYVPAAFWLLIIMSDLMPNNVDAGWVAIDQQYQSPGLQTVYIDPDSMRREGHLVTISALIDWTWMQGNRSPARFYSTIMTKQFDCIEKMVRSLSATDFYGHMGTGDPVGGGGHTNEGQWIPIESGTLNQGLWEAACGKR